MATFSPSHAALARSYGAYAFSGPEDAYDPEADEERRRLEAEGDHQALMKVFGAGAGLALGMLTGTYRSAQTNSDLAETVIPYALIGGAAGYFLTHLYFKVQTSTEDIFSYEDYGV